MKIASLEIDLLANIARLQQDMRRAEGTVERSMRQIEGQIQRVQRAFGALGLGVGFGAMIRQVQQLADAWQGMENRLRLVTRTQTQLARSMDDVYRIARGTSQQMDSVGQVYQRFAENAGQLGLNLSDVADLTNTVAKAVAISGASAQAAEAAIIQFGQAMASAELRGEELRSVMEQTPGLARAIADGLGVPIGALRDLAEQGKLTANEVIRALRNAADSVDAKFATRVKTIGQAWTDLNTELTKFVGQMSQATGASQSMVSVIDAIANNLDGIGRSLMFIAATAVPSAVRALWSLTAAMLAVPGMQLVKLLGVAAGALLAFHDKIKIPEGALKGLNTTWDLFGAAFSTTSKVVLEALDSIGSGTLAFFDLFDFAPAQAASNLQDPFQKAALAVAGVFDRMYAGFTGNLSAIGAAFRATVYNIETWLYSMAETATETLGRVAAAFNSVFGTEISVSPFVGPENREYLDIIEEAKKAFQEGQKVLGMRNALVQTIAQQTLEGLNDAFDIALVEEHTAAIRNNGDGAGKAASAYQTLIASLRSKIEQNQLEIATGEKATEADKLRIKVIQDLAAGRLKLTAAQKQQVEMLLKGLKASESELNISRMVQAAKKKEVDLSVEAVKAAYDEARKNEHLAETFGMTAAQVEQLTLSRLEEKLAQAESLKLTAEEIKALELLIEAKQKNIAALGTIEAREKQKAAWEDWSRDVEQIFQQVGQSLTDAIFEGGKSARDLVKDLFKTLTLRVLVQPMLAGLQGMVTNQLGGMFGYQNPQQGGIGGLAQNASSLNSIFGAGYQALTGATPGASTASLGYANLVGLTGGDSIGALISANGGWEGALSGLSSATSAAITAGAISAAPSVAASLSAPLASSMATTSFSATLGGGAAAAGAGGAGGLLSGIAAAGPWIAGGLAVASLLGGGLFDREPTTRREQRTQVEYAGGLFDVTKTDDRAPAGADAAARALAEQAVQTANDIFKQVGVDAAIDSFHAIMASSYQGDRDGVASGGQLRIGDAYRQFGIDLNDPNPTIQGFGGWSSAETLPRLATDIQLSVLEAFQSLSDELPSVLSAMLEGIDIRSLGEQEAQALAERFTLLTQGASQFLAAIETMPFEQLRDLSFDAAAGMVQFAGGIDGLIASQQTYYERFYSEQEHFERSVELIGKALSDVGQEMPALVGSTDDMLASYRALVESLDLNTEAGQQAYVTLMQTAGAFADVAQFAGQAAVDVERAAEDQRRAAEQARQQALSDLSAAYNAVVQAGQREIARLQESFGATDSAMNAYRGAVQRLESEFNSLFSAIDRGVQALRGTGAAFDAQYHQARAVISTTLLTGQLPQTADLSEAIRVAQQGVMGQRFASREDQQRAYLTLANEMEAIKEIAGPELDAAQATLAQLEDQYRLLRGMSEVGEDSLSALEAQLRTALSTEEAARYQIGVIEQQLATAQQQYNTLVGIEDAVVSGFQRLALALEEFAKASANPILGGGGGGGGAWDPASYAAKNPDLAEYYAKNAGDRSGLSFDQWLRKHYDDYGRSEGRSYDVGTSFVPYDMMANIHRGEIIIDPRSSDILRRYGIGVQGGGSSRETEQLLREQLAEVRQQNRYLYEMVKSGKRTERNTEDTANAVGAHSPSEGAVVVY